MWPGLADVAAKVEAVAVRQADVEDDEVDRLAVQEGQGVGGQRPPVHLPALAVQGVGQRVGDRGVVFNQEDVFGTGHGGGQVRKQKRA